MPITVRRHVAASPEAVWDLLVDLDAWPSWGPTVTAAALDEDGPLRLGSRGRVRTPVGVWLPFEVTSFAQGRHWGWRVAGVPATTHDVEPDGTGTRLAMSAPAWAPAYVPVLALGMRRIDRLATRR